MFLSLLNPEFGRAFLSAHLVRLDGRSLSALCLSDAAAGRHWFVQYLLPRVSGELPITIQSLPEAKVEKGCAAIQKQVGQLSAGEVEAGQWIAAIPQLSVLISPYPLDFRLEHLAEANDPLRVRRLCAHRECNITSAAGVFLAEYERYSGCSVDSLRLSYYLASACFRLACKYRIRQQSEYLVERLLALAVSALGRRVAV